MMNNFFLLLFLFNFGIFCYGFNGNRILNGVPAPADKFMNVVRIYAMSLLPEIVNEDNTSIGFGLCTSTIISDRHILTAAHCVVYPGSTDIRPAVFIDHRPVADMSKMKGNINFSAFGMAFTAYAHDFHWQHFQNDVAILEFNLPKGVKLGEPVKLAKNYEEGVNDIGTNVGYGDANPDPAISEPAADLMLVNLSIWPQKDCKPNKPDYPIICAGNATHRPSGGDSGGPFFFDAIDGKQYQIGVAHDGAMKNGTATDGTPAQGPADMGVYQRVAPYCDWIEEKTKGAAKCVDMPQSSPEPNPVPPAEPLKDGAMSNNIFIIIFAFVLAKIVFNV